ncbi:hypothetical protein [Occallatibacter savannae]|uniref:hypothetical protein n=1 Tax=Occallatibacter savannae TaxID=1002691 RepID=UPI000D68B5D4|nr:hypothetical protein [Occallatibacter savannae]
MKARSSIEFVIDAFDCKVSVRSDSEATLECLNQFLLPALPRSAVSREPAEIAISVLSEKEKLAIFVDGVQVSFANTLQDAALGAVKALDEAIVRKLKRLRPVHAGAVVLHRKALLVPGSSRAGKSSLVAELLSRGAAHLSDEYALVDQDGRVHAYPRPLLLRNGSPKQTLVLPAELKASYASEAAPVGTIVAVEYAPEGSWKIERISHGEAVMLLLRNTPHEMGEAPEMIDFFTRCVAGADCYAGTRGDVVEAADRILELVGDSK